MARHAKSLFTTKDGIVRLLGCVLFCVYLVYIWMILEYVQNYNEDMPDTVGIENRSTWMSELSGAATLVPISWLAIPGSHNSGSYNLQPNFGVAPNLTIGVKLLYYLPFGSTVITRWSQTQVLTFTQQLIAGVRYFDMRVAYHLDTREFRFVHGLYADLVFDVLEEIKQFIHQFRKEIVILDLNRLYDMEEREHDLLLKKIREIFKEDLVPLPTSNLNETKLRELTLQTMWRTSHRVIVIYQDDDSIKPYPNIWPMTYREEAFVRKFDVNVMIEEINKLYVNKTLSQHYGLHIWQGISTPNALDNIFNPFTGLYPTGTRATLAFTFWLKDKIPGQDSVAICTADFVEKHDFIGTVINLNVKLHV